MHNDCLKNELKHDGHIHDHAFERHKLYTNGQFYPEEDQCQNIEHA